MTLNVVLNTQPTMGFYLQGAPPAAALINRRLMAIGAIRRPLGPNASIPTTSVDLQNGDGALTRLFVDPPLRARATIAAGAIAFDGIVAGVTLGPVIALAIEAGGFWSLADAVPLRNTTAWGSYKDARTIPHVYGRVILTPIPYDPGGRVFVLADHAIAGVDEALRDDVVTAAYKFRNGVDSTGHAVAFLELADPLAPGERLAVRMRGKVNAQTGALLIRPAEVVHDFLSALCGFDLPFSDFDALRAQTAHLEVHGIVADANRTIRSQIDEIMVSVGAVWSMSMPGFGRLWPWPDDANEPARAEIGARADLTASSDHADIYTVLRVIYDYDHAAARHRRALQVEAPDAINSFGRIERELDARWLRSPREAEALAKRLLQHDARPRWRIVAGDRLRDVPPGVIATIDHPHAPVAGRQLVFDTEADVGGQRMRLTFQAPAGQAPAVVLAKLSSAFEPVIPAGAFVDFRDGVATFTIRGENNEPLAGARVTLDGVVTRVTDAAGRVQFQAARGRHSLYIEASGYAPMAIEVVL